MKRRLFAVLFLLSLLAWIATCAVWFRQMHHGDFLHRWRAAEDNQSGTLIIVESLGGWIAVDRTKYTSVEPWLSVNFRKMPAWATQAVTGTESRLNSLPGAHGGQRLGFAAQWIGTSNFTWFRLVVPLWFVFTTSGVVCVHAFWVLRRERRRVALGHCTVCGYNLTGNVSGVCPECGKAIPPSSTEAT